jgi:hypothetical protein
LDARLWRYPKAREGLFCCLEFLGRVADFDDERRGVAVEPHGA